MKWQGLFCQFIGFLVPIGCYLTFKFDRLFSIEISVLSPLWLRFLIGSMAITWPHPRRHSITPFALKMRSINWICSLQSTIIELFHYGNTNRNLTFKASAITCNSIDADLNSWTACLPVLSTSEDILCSNRRIANISELLTMRTNRH